MVLSLSQAQLVSVDVPKIISQVRKLDLEACGRSCNCEERAQAVTSIRFAHGIPASMERGSQISVRSSRLSFCSHVPVPRRRPTTS
jgi:hypothetical protein